MTALSPAPSPTTTTALGRFAQQVMDLDHCLLMVRHGQTGWNRQDRLATRSDVPLCENGVEQALGLSGALAGAVFDTASCSPRQRARLTGSIGLRYAVARAPMLPDARLAEPDAGVLEGVTFSELRDGPLAAIYAAYSDELAPIYPEGAEPHHVTVAKASSFLADIAASPGRHVAFSHGAFIRLLVCVFLGHNPCMYRRLKLDNCHGVLLKFYPTAPHQLLGLNLPPV